MRTRYKILLVITTSAIIYILFHGGISNTCLSLSYDRSVCHMFWLFDTSIHIQTSDHIWDTGNGIGSWSGTAKLMEEAIFYDTLKDNSGFIFWHMILPTFVILLMYQRDRLKK